MHSKGIHTPLVIVCTIRNSLQVHQYEIYIMEHISLMLWQICPYPFKLAACRWCLHLNAK